MILEEILRDERAEGRAEGEKIGLEIGLAKGQTQNQWKGIIRILSSYGEVPEEIQRRICEETDLETLDAWFDLALESRSVEAFEEQMERKRENGSLGSF